MPDHQPIFTTSRFRFVKGPHFETRRVSGTIVRGNSTQTVSLLFYVERDEIEKLAIFKYTNGELDKDSPQLEKEEGAVVELQQAILLDRNQAEALRNQLDVILAKNSNELSHTKAD